MYGGKMSGWQNVWWQKLWVAKCPGGKILLVAEYSFFQSCKLSAFQNVWVAKCLMAKSGKMFWLQNVRFLTCCGDKKSGEIPDVKMLCVTMSGVRLSVKCRKGYSSSRV